MRKVVENDSVRYTYEKANFHIDYSITNKEKVTQCQPDDLLVR
jgi:hypothetical protein